MEENSEFKISRKNIYAFAAAAGALLTAAWIFAQGSPPLAVAVLLSAGIIWWAAAFAYGNREKMSEMHCMMNGMAFGMMASFAIGVLVALPKGDFMLGIIAGTAAGLLAGIPVAEAGGRLARMEGVMAAPMGGAMGAMLGVMIRFYDVQLFMQFFFVTLIFIMYEMTKANESHCKCAVPAGLKYFGLILGVATIVSTFLMAYGVGTPSGGVIGLQGGDVQEIAMKIESWGYVPDKITVKNNVPVKISLQASPEAGCTRSIVFRDFGVSKTVAAGGTGTIEFTPTKVGTYQFSCAMGMARGTLVVQ